MKHNFSFKYFFSINSISVSPENIWWYFLSIIWNEILNFSPLMRIVEPAWNLFDWIDFSWNDLAEPINGKFSGKSKNFWWNQQSYIIIRLRWEDKSFIGFDWVFPDIEIVPRNQEEVGSDWGKLIQIKRETPPKDWTNPRHHYETRQLHFSNFLPIPTPSLIIWILRKGS